jgi:hypothetical protein
MNLGLPSIIDTGVSPDHSNWHNLIEGWLAGATYGPRETYGQRPIAEIPEWPDSFTSGHSTFASLESAVNAGGTGRKFEITDSFALTAVIQPHANDEFWFDDGVTITRGAAISNAIKPATAVDGVKVVNGRFDGFNAATGTGNGGATDCVISSNGGSFWQVGRCEVVNSYILVQFGIGAGFCLTYLCHMQGIGGAITGFAGHDQEFRDNYFDGCGDSSSTGGHKMVGTDGMYFHHNRFRGCARGGLWFDTGNSRALVEWNIIEDTGGASPMGGIVFERNCWENEGIIGVDQGTKILISNGNHNIVRYNLLQNNLDVALAVLQSSGNVFYENTCIGDVINQPNNGSIHLKHDGDQVVNMDGFDMTTDCEENHFNYNHITQLATNRDAVDFDVVDEVDTTPYVNNTKDNSFDHNDYNLDSAAHVAFLWVGVAKIFTEWQAIPQDVNGSAV